MHVKYGCLLMALALAGCSSPCTDDNVKQAIDKIVMENYFLLGLEFMFAEKSDIKMSTSDIEVVKKSDTTTCSATITVQNTKNGGVVQKPVRYVVSTLPDGRPYVNLYGLNR